MSELSMIRVLLIEDEEYDVRRVMNTIKPFSHRIVISDVVSNGTSALELLQVRDRYDVVIMDFQIAGGLMGEQLIREIKRRDSAVEIIVITKMTVNISDLDFADGLLKAGAFWYCTKYPGDIEEYIYQPTDFILSILNAYQKKILEGEKNRSTRKFARTIEDLLEQRKILGSSAAIEAVRQQIVKCAESSAHVLISGPSGTGKEYVAQNIHYMSQRRLENFVPVNCGSLPGELVESELFGYEKGAFTGANSRKLGLFEVANHGTLFLDEIAELPPAAQVKLLRVLQEGEIEKIGRTEKIKVDVRIIAATNKDLEQEVEEKRFREDLFYRLNVVPIAVPPLSARREDIPTFVQYFLRLFSAEAGREAPAAEPEALRCMVDYDWPGNVRQLRNLVHRLLFDNTPTITLEQVQLALGRGRPVGGGNGDAVIDFSGEIIPWRQMERSMREKYFRYVRKQSASDAEAAKKLGLAPPNYHRMCKEMGLK